MVIVYIAILVLTAMYDYIIEEFKLTKIDKLGFSMGQRDFGYILLSNGRSGNVAMHQWYTEEVVTPYIHRAETC